MKELYSLEEIEVAVHWVIIHEHGTPISLAQAVIAKLTKPKFQPEEGEVFAYSINSEQVLYTNNPDKINPGRPLAPSEVPALKIGIKAMEDAGRSVNLFNAQMILKAALIEINKRIAND